MCDLIALGMVLATVLAIFFQLMESANQLGVFDLRGSPARLIVLSVGGDLHDMVVTLTDDRGRPYGPYRGSCTVWRTLDGKRASLAMESRLHEVWQVEKWRQMDGGDHDDD